MAILKNDKHKEYTRFAAHCLEMVTITREQESGPFNAKWLPNGCGWRMLFFVHRNPGHDLLGVPVQPRTRRSSVRPFSANERAPRWRT
jgi:hypothetical protein